MSLEGSIPTPPLPGKDPPLQPSLKPASVLSRSNQPIPSSQLSASKSMPQPPVPQIHLKLTSTLPLEPSEVSPTPAIPRPIFSPFFTLINDATNQSTHHPSRIHYIFSDDDESELLTAACVRSLQQEDESPAASRELAGSEQEVRESETSSSSSALFKKGGERQKENSRTKAPVKREERAIIVDMNSTGDGVVSTSSLSACWQVVNAEITNAPTLNNDNTGDGDEDGEERGLMLKIEGVGLEGAIERMGDSGEKRRGKGIGESGVVGEEDMQTLMEGFDRKMGLLRKIVASGESRDEARKDKSVLEVKEDGNDEQQP